MTELNVAFELRAAQDHLTRAIGCLAAAERAAVDDVQLRAKIQVPATMTQESARRIERIRRALGLRAQFGPQR